MCDLGMETLTLRGATDTEDFVLGVCTAVAVFADSLIAGGVLERDDVIGMLDTTEAAVSNRYRKLALRTVSVFVEKLGKISGPANDQGVE
jgi:hypothetical protein